MSGGEQRRKSEGGRKQAQEAEITKNGMGVVRLGHHARRDAAAPSRPRGQNDGTEEPCAKLTTPKSDWLSARQHPWGSYQPTREAATGTGHSERRPPLGGPFDGAQGRLREESLKGASVAVPGHSRISAND